LTPQAQAGRRRRRCLPVAILLSLAAARSAEAQTVYVLDGTLNLNYTTTNPPTPYARGVVTEIRPSVMLQTGGPQFAWRVSYLFVGNLSLDGNWANTYANQLISILAMELSSVSTMSITANLNQGGTAFQLTQSTPAAGSPAIRAEGNPNLVTAVLSEMYSLDLTARLRLGQGLTGTLVAPQFSLSDYNASVGGYLRFDLSQPSDAFGVELAPSVAWLRASGTAALPETYMSLMQSVVLDWNHDFNQGWNTQVAGGAAYIVSLVGDHPSTFAPIGTLTGRYFGSDVNGSVSLNYGPNTNLQTATVSQTASLTARGSWSFNPLLQRSLAASAGFLRSRPLGAVSESSTSGMGDALQGDIGVIWGLTETWVANVRYTVAYQFNQPGGIAPSLAHVFLIGVTGHYSNASHMPPMPTPGQRVDGSDGVRFGAKTQ
jgi:hypothetical protein